MVSVEETALVIVDVQGKLADIVHESELVVGNIERLIQGVQLLGIPIIWMEQYPEGLGPTREQLRKYLLDETYVSKRTFSACLEDNFMDEIEKLKAKSFIVVGVEAHVCVYQTVRDLLKKDYEIEVVVDAVSSRTEANRTVGIEKMRSLGAQITSTEMVLFDLMKTSKHPRFKEISALIK